MSLDGIAKPVDAARDGLLNAQTGVEHCRQRPDPDATCRTVSCRFDKFGTGQSPANTLTRCAHSGKARSVVFWMPRTLRRHSEVAAESDAWDLFRPFCLEFLRQAGALGVAGTTDSNSAPPRSLDPLVLWPADPDCGPDTYTEREKWGQKEGAGWLYQIQPMI